MDLIRTMLVYMMLVVGAATEASPALTPPPVSPAQSPAVIRTTATPAPTATPLPTRVPTQVPTLVPTRVPTPSPAPYTTLYVNDRGEAVKTLQRRLTELGYLNDKIDGIYGQNTKRAVERFQYYNNLTVDGVAGPVTQAVLFRSASVVTAPPNITPGPTPTMAPSVTVPVYYVDENGRLLKRVDMACYGSTTIYANSDNVGSDYVLISGSAVTVTVRNGVATPASVTFRYRKQAPDPTASLVTVPVYYVTDTGITLYQSVATLARGTTSYVSAYTNLVPANYQLLSASSAAVYVSPQGVATPATVTFTFRNITPTPTPTPTASPEPQIRVASVPVRYISENGTFLYQTVQDVDFGTTVPVYAYSDRVAKGYALISESPVYVTVSAFGQVNPPVVTFTFVYRGNTEAPTAVPPTQAPTEAPTALPPTQAPTEAPTAVPPTQAPTTVPDEVPGQTLTLAGESVLLNGQTVPLKWYRDENGNTLVNLQYLAISAGWAYAVPGDGDLNGHAVSLAYDGQSIQHLTVDGQPQQQNACVWNGYVYVNLNFLRALDMDARATGGELIITFPQT